MLLRYISYILPGQSKGAIAMVMLWTEAFRSLSFKFRSKTYIVSNSSVADLQHMFQLKQLYYQHGADKGHEVPVIQMELLEGIRDPNQYNGTLSNDVTTVFAAMMNDYPYQDIYLFTLETLLLEDFHFFPFMLIFFLFLLMT